MADVFDVRVRYRLAKFVTVADPDVVVEDAPTLETMIRSLLAGQLGNDVNERVLPTVEDQRHSVCLHFSQLTQGALAFDLLHLDDRKVVPTWKRPNKPVPVSTLGGTAIGKDEVNLNEPAYLMISGNHVAVIERVGLRTPTIENYLNAVLAKAAAFDQAARFWKLVPRVEAVGVAALRGGVEKIIVKPYAALVGEADSQLALDRKPRRYNRKIDEFIGYGQRIIDMLEVFGAKEGDIESLRKKMSSDLVLKARVEISVSRAERASEAKISADDMQNTVNALSAAMASWAAKGVIEI